MTILDDILATKRRELAEGATRPALPRSLVAQNQRRSSPSLTPRRSLAGALRRPAGAPVRVLAEIKRASPSAGPIRPDADPAEIAREYAGAGAAAISVLTDKKYFDGDLSFLRPCREAVGVPLLRKDFLIDPSQLAESWAFGADAVLLIVAALPGPELGQMMRELAHHDLEALVEVHDLAELDAALAQGAKLIGVNHRDLRTFQIDMSLTERIAAKVPGDVVLVAESGIKTAADVRRLGDAGAHAVLVGETLMRAPSPGAALRELLR